MEAVYMYPSPFTEPFVGCTTAASLESTLAERSLDSLPEVLSEVALMQQGQLDELHKQQQLVQDAEVRIVNITTAVSQ